MTIIQLALQMALMVLAGILARKTHIVDDKFSVSASSLILNLILPCMIVDVLNIELSLDQLHAGILLIGLSILVFIIIIILATLFSHLASPQKDAFSKAMRYAITFSNYAFMGYPVARTLYGSEGLFGMTLFTIFIRLAFYLSAPLILSGSSENSTLNNKRILLRPLLSPPVIAVVIGLTLYLTPITVPVPLSNALSSIGSASTPMGMLVCGMTIANVPLKSIFDDRRVILTALARNLLAPALVLLVLIFLPIDTLSLHIAVIYSALPIASSLSPMSIKYETAPELSATSIFISTLLSIITLPLWVWILSILRPF